ncbi:MAG: ATPase [Treponema sp.]|nr:ATPase [Treponema sp.]
MAKTTEMRLMELMVLKQDISSVIEYIGRKGSFQFQSKTKDEKQKKLSDAEEKLLDIDHQFFDNLNKISADLNIPLEDPDFSEVQTPTEEDRSSAAKFIAAYNELSERITAAQTEADKVEEAYKEAQAFSNLQVSYNELEHLSFLSLRIGKIDSSSFDDIKDDLNGEAVVIALGEDKSHILVASSKKNRTSVDNQLKDSGFVPIEVPEDFKGVPADVLEGLEVQKRKAKELLEELEVEKSNFAETHKDKLHSMLKSFNIGSQIAEVQRTLESTELVYRITGWLPHSECETYMKELDNITEGRIAIRVFEPFEVPSVISGKEQVPVKLTHGKFIKSFERMIFSYGAPVYGTIDPTPFVAIFFTLLFGIMFGDLGQGLVFVLAGILMATKVIKVGGWNKFAPIFIAIGCTSSVMGLLTGEFFSNETLLEPFSRWVTGLFGEPRNIILEVMPKAGGSLKVMFGLFGVAVGVGFIINSIGLIINIVNNFILKRYDEAIFGKNGIAGACFFWYVVTMVVRVALFKQPIAYYDWIVIGVTLFFAAFAEPFENLVMRRKPVLENGFGTYVISSVVEIIEVISGYLSNTVSFVRVGAFALSHAVLDYVILLLVEMVTPEGAAMSVAGIFIMIIGNALIVVLEGMIVAIQVIRLQYYEFFSKFFHENGKEFKPFKFSYGE